MFVRRSPPCPEILVRNLVCVLAVSHDQFRHAPRVQNLVRTQMKVLRHEVRHVCVGVEIGEIAFPCVAYASSTLKSLTDDYSKKASASLIASGKDCMICAVAFKTDVGIM